jgi:prolycopene isomerase
MEKYDVVVIGGGIGSLTTATYLSKRLRNVAVFEETKQKKLLKYTERLKDDANNKYVFKLFHHDLGGVHEGDLFHEYLKRCGLTKAFDYIDNAYTMVVGEDHRVMKRPNNIKDFKVYLVRYYPRQRDQIHALFEDIERHYEDYKIQKSARLQNKEYTLPSVLIEWGDLSLDKVLSKYVSDERLKHEFIYVYDSLGFGLKDINAYNYFIKFFDTFIDGSHFIASSFSDVVKRFTSEISKVKEKIFTGRKIEKFVFEDNKIVKAIDTDGKEIVASHFVINMRLDDFINTYLPEREELLHLFETMYPHVQDGRYINQLYIGLDRPAEECGIKEMQYMFGATINDEMLCSVLNYKLLDDSCCDDGLGAILVEFIDDDTMRKDKLNEVIDRLAKFFPGIVDHISVSKLSTKESLFSGMASKEYWNNKTVNDLFDIDDYSYINPFDNTYFIGSWLRPEAGITGMIQTGVEYGDIIDDLIYRGDEDEYFITHDELMAIISNQFIPGGLGKDEKNVQFFIGKDAYHIRTKAKHLRVYEGVTEIADIIIIATNECLYDLSVGNTTLEQAIETGSLEYVGEKDFLDQVIEAFDMGIQVQDTSNFKFYSGRWGMLFGILLLSTLLLSNLLSNYHPYLITAPITVAVIGGIGYFKFKKLGYISVFEIVSVVLYVGLFIGSLFSSSLNEMEDSKYTTLFYAVYLLITWLINRPVLFGFIKFDYRTDYTRTKLFMKMAGGLTFIWGFIFLTISLFSFTTSSTYSSLTYYLVVLGLYLMYYYPTRYIKGNIVRKEK